MSERIARTQAFIESLPPSARKALLGKERKTTAEDGKDDPSRLCALSPKAPVLRAFPKSAVLCDQWDNKFGNLLQAWPDVYYLIDATTLEVLARSTYGAREEALLDVDCVDVIHGVR